MSDRPEPRNLCLPTSLFQTHKSDTLHVRESEKWSFLTLVSLFFYLDTQYLCSVLFPFCRFSGLSLHSVAGKFQQNSFKKNYHHAYQLCLRYSLPSGREPRSHAVCQAHYYYYQNIISTSVHSLLAPLPSPPYK